MLVRMVNPGFGGEAFASPHNVAGLVAIGWEIVPGQSLPADDVVDTTETVDVEDAEPTGDAEVVGRPARSASRKAWAEYAQTLGVEPGVLTRGDLIAAVDAL